jgi:hypothetical protein
MRPGHLIPDIDAVNYVIKPWFGLPGPGKNKADQNIFEAGHSDRLARETRLVKWIS